MTTVTCHVFVEALSNLRLYPPVQGMCVHSKQQRTSKATHTTAHTAACALWYKIQVYDLKSYVRPTDNGVLLHMRGGAVERFLGLYVRSL
jgi:hypothetical protein